MVQVSLILFLALAIVMRTQTVLCAIGSAKKADSFKVGVAIQGWLLCSSTLPLCAQISIKTPLYLIICRESLYIAIW